MTYAGTGSKVGGTLARVFGWMLLVGGTFFALALAAFLQALFPAGVAGYVLGLPLAALSLVLGFVLLRGGSKLRAEGDGQRRARFEHAVGGLAQARGGRVTALAAAQALDLPVDEAEAILTDLAKRRPDAYGVEVDEEGNVHYRVGPAPRARVGDGPRIADVVTDDRWAEAEAAAARDAASSGARRGRS